MTPDDRARAAKALLANPLTRDLFAAMRQDHLEAIAASPLPDVDQRAYSYTATRVLAEMLGQLEVWARPLSK